MRHVRSREYWGLCLVIVCLMICDLPAATQSTPASESTDCTPYGDMCLGPTAVAVAKEACSKVYEKDCSNAENNNNNCTRTYKDKQGKDLSPRCAWDLILKLSKIPAADRCGSRATEALVLRQEINDLVVTASLQVDGFLAEIDSETGLIRAVHDDLSDRRDTAVSHSTLGSAIGTGGGAAGSSLALARKTATVGNWVGAVAGGVGTLFGFLGWYQQPRGPKGCFPDVGDKHCQVTTPVSCDSATSACSPTMLFHLVFPDALPEEVRQYASFHSEYDLPIEKYLADHKRGDSLVQQWLNKAKDEKKKKAAAASDPLAVYPNYALKSAEPYLFASNNSPGKVSIDDLSKRADKLADLRSVVARMNRDLSRLTETLAAELKCPPDEPDSQ